MQALILVRSNGKNAESLAERLVRINGVDNVMLLETREILVLLTFESTEGLTQAIRQIREAPGVQSTETKLVLSRLRGQKP